MEFNRNEIRDALSAKKEKTNNKFLALGVAGFAASLVATVAASTNGAIAFPELSQMASDIGLNTLPGLYSVLATSVVSLGSVIRANKSTSVSNEEVDNFILKKKDKVGALLDKFRSPEENLAPKFKM